MAPQMKRPAAASPAPKAKRQQEDPLVAKCNQVLAVLRTATGYPEATLEMLEVGARPCLMAPRESQGELQRSMLEMVGEVLSSVEASHIAAADALRRKIAEADVEKKSREIAFNQADAAIKEKVDAVEAAENALKDARAATDAGDKALKVATAEQKAGDADLAKAGDRKTSAEQAVSEALSPLKDGTAADVGKAVKMLANVGKELGLEAQLFQSAELAFRKAPAERGQFDGMVAQQIDEQLKQAIATLAGQLANGEAAKAARAARVASCTDQASADARNSMTCQEQLAAAKAALKDADAARTAAAKAVEDFGWEMVEAQANVEAADNKLACCKADLATFTELVEGPAAAPEAPPAEAEEEAASPAKDAEAVLAAAPEVAVEEASVAADTAPEA